MRDKHNVPPIRVLVIGDDRSFRQFVKDYVYLLGFDQVQSNELLTKEQVDLSK